MDQKKEKKKRKKKEKMMKKFEFNFISLNKTD